MAAENLPKIIAEQLRDMIVRGVLSPGEHLGQTQLAEKFGVSRVPIREALKLLAAEGMIDHNLNRGYEVSRMSLDEARQLYKLRRWIEAELLDTAVWPTEEQVRSIADSFAKSEQGLLDKDRAVWRRHLREARLAILDLSPQKALLKEALRLWGLTDRYRSILPIPDPVASKESEEYERSLLVALKQRDRPRLLEAYHKERDRIEAMLLSILASQAP